MNRFTLFDGNLLIGIQHLLNADWFTPVMKLITMFGEGGYFWIAVCLLLMIMPKTRRLGTICTLSLAFTFICCNLIIKPAVDRTRPWVLFSAVNAMLPPPGDASFPSGHSANAMAPAWAMFLASRPVRAKLHMDKEGSGDPKTSGKGDIRIIRSYKDTPCLGWKGRGADPAVVHKLGIAAVVLAVLIGISRLYLGMHFPSDVVCGLLLGMICAGVVHTVILKSEARRGTIGGSEG